MRDANSIERRYAEFYRLYTRDFRRDLRVYLDCAAKLDTRVLEVGCRTGRVSAALARAGHEVVGIDTSRPMLELAVREVHPYSERVSVVDHDLRSGPLAERFGLAVVTLFSFNDLIDVEEQRLFLRHLLRSLSAAGVVLLDLFCPLSLVRPEEADRWRDIERTSEGLEILVRDRRDMLTPLLERRTQSFKVEGGLAGEYTAHRRYVPPTQARDLLREAGFERVQWIQGYDPSTARGVEDGDSPNGPFLIKAWL